MTNISLHNGAVAGVQWRIMDPALIGTVAFVYVSLMGAIWQSHLALSRKIDRQGERLAEQGERISQVEHRLTRIEAHIAAG